MILAVSMLFHPMFRFGVIGANIRLPISRKFKIVAIVIEHLKPRTKHFACFETQDCDFLLGRDCNCSQRILIGKDKFIPSRQSPPPQFFRKSLR